MKIKSAAEAEIYFSQTGIPKARYNRNFLTTSEAVVLATSGPPLDVVIASFNYGFSKGWRAAIKYQKEKARK